MQVNTVTNSNKVNETTNSNKSVKNNSSGRSFQSYLGESESLDVIFQKAADKYGVDVKLLKAIGKQESNFNPKAVSRCGATGIMQLMPATAKGLGVKDSTDAEQNIMGGAKYVRTLLDRYQGDTKLALAAYNAGSGNVKKYGGVPPFKETQNYVKKVMGYYNQSGDSSKSAVTGPNKNTDNSQSAENAAAYASSSTTNITDQLKAYVDQINQKSDVSKVDDVFSYDDYMRFMEIFLQDDDNKETQNQNYANGAFGKVQITPAISGLFKGIQ